MMITCTRRLTFCAGHRVKGHENKCANLHGHNYVVEITTAPKDGLDRLGRVIDFGIVKARVGEWLDTHWDHGFIVWDQDDEAIHAIQRVEAQKKFYLPWNPTAENLARYLATLVCPHLFHESDVKVVHVRIWETENCVADYYG